MRLSHKLVVLGGAIALGTCFDTFSGNVPGNAPGNIATPRLEQGLFSISTAQAQVSHAPFEIELAYKEAVRTGQFRTHLAPYVHPELQNSIDNYWLFETTEADANSSISSTIRPVNAEDFILFEQYYQDYIEPTHVIEVNVSQPWVTSGISGSTVPIYVQQTAHNWYIVFGTTFRAPNQIAESLAEQRFSYTQSSTGLWQHNWDLQFEQDTAYRYTLQLRDTQSNTVLETFDTGDADNFNNTQWKINFRLQPEGTPTAYQMLPQGGVSLPYAYQIGRSAIASATMLPLARVTQFEPISALKFERDRLSLARLHGRAADREKTLVIEVIRTAY